MDTKTTGGGNLDARIEDLRAQGVRVRIVDSPDPHRPLAVTADQIMIGGDAPVALERPAATLARVRTYLRSELPPAKCGNPKAERLWAALASAETTW